MYERYRVIRRCYRPLFNIRVTRGVNKITISPSGCHERWDKYGYLSAADNANKPTVSYASRSIYGLSAIAIRSALNLLWITADSATRPGLLLTRDPRTVHYRDLAPHLRFRLERNNDQPNDLFFSKFREIRIRFSIREFSRVSLQLRSRTHDEVKSVLMKTFRSRAILTLARAKRHIRTHERGERKEREWESLCDKRVIVQAERRLRRVGREKDNLTIHDVKWLQLFCATCTY